jgi:hypothetical protein
MSILRNLPKVLEEIHQKHLDEQKVKPSNPSIQEELELIRESLTALFNKICSIENKLESINQETCKNNITSVEKLSNTILQNSKDIRNMLGEFKGILCIIRPEVRKTGWYGEEVEGKFKSPEPLEITSTHTKDRLGVTRYKKD